MNQIKTKMCSSCKIEKSVMEFTPREKGSKDGYLGRCRKCVNESLAQYYKINNEKIRAYRRNYGRISRYGISELDVVEMIKNQDGICVICERKINSDAHVDHDHETGQVRAILCKNCNIALGLLGDDCGNIMRAFDYLMYHKCLPENEKYENEL